MTDREFGLLRAVCADPSDDAPRMILADWWDEHGRPERAEFLRVQCALARFPSTACDCDRSPELWDANCHQCALRARERNLLTAHEIEWARPLLDILWPHPKQPVHGDLVFRRGFVASLTLSAADWLKHADALYWHPTQTGRCEDCWLRRIGRVHTVCEACNSTGRVPRPFPPTAQPIEAVRLRTWPDFTHYTIDRAGVTSFRGRSLRRQMMDLLGPYQGGGGLSAALLAAEWPHVRFESLAESAAHYSREATAT